jgi:hypothetical protein
VRVCEDGGLSEACAVNVDASTVEELGPGLSVPFLRFCGEKVTTCSIPACRLIFIWQA